MSHCQNCADKDKQITELERQLKELRAFTQRFDVRVRPLHLTSQRYHGKPAHILSIEDDLACDTGSNSCVECTIDEEELCNGKSCNPATLTCTNTNVDSRDFCESCVADSECTDGDTNDPTARCIALDFNGGAHGSYCLKRQSKTCARPYGITINAESISDAPDEDYCGIDQDTTTCEAVLDMVASTSCSGGTDAECGDGEGGQCKTVGGIGNTCTIPCDVANQCPNALTCTGGMPYCH